MTFIIAGKISNKTFLMVDCVGTTYENGEKIFVFSDKIYKLKSCEVTYYTLTGSDAFTRSIDIYDTYCYKNNINIDHKSDLFIQKVIEIFKSLIKREEYVGKGNIYKPVEFNRIYFISDNSLFYYSISHKGDNVAVFTKKEVENNNIIDADYSSNDPKQTKLKFEDATDLNSYCENEISKNASKKYGISLKNKYNFILFENCKSVYKSPILDEAEMVLGYVCGKYSELK